MVKNPSPLFLLLYHFWLFPLFLYGKGDLFLLTLNGPIGPATKEYVLRGIESAEKESASCLILRMNTPGGLDEAMREIVRGILQAKVPFITFVYPPGARAASAGTFLVMASHIAAMANGTAIGAAHPVQIGGGEGDEEMKNKLVNDAVSLLKSLAQKRNRDTTFAVEAVKKSLSLTEREALERRVIEVLANSEDELLNQIEGRRIEIANKEIYLRVLGKTKKVFTMNDRERFFQILTNPNLAYILLLLGMYGLIFELQSPGAIFPGVFGAISLITALYSFQILPVNYAGLALIGLSFLLFLLELKITSYGLLSLGGIISFVMGSLLLFPSSPFPFAKTTIIVIGLITLILFLIIISLGIRAHIKNVATGKEGMIDLVGEVSEDFSTSGQIFVRGEYWQAISLSGPLKKGERVRVVEVNGMVLKVKKCE